MSGCIQRLDTGSRRPSVDVLAAGPHELELRRVDARTLALRSTWLDAPAERNHRSAAAPMRVGDRVELGALTITVTAIDDRGRPRSIEVQIPELDDLDAIEWYAWIDGAPAALELPAIGEVISLAPAAWRFD